MFSRLSRVFPVPLNSSHWSSPHPHRCSCSPFLYNPKELASIFTPHVPGNISLVVPAWTELPTSPCMNCILLSEFTGILPALPVALTPATDMWALTHDSSQHLSCFPKSKSSDQAHHQVQIWSTLKNYILWPDALRWSIFLATSENTEFVDNTNASVVRVHPTITALLLKYFS